MLESKPTMETISLNESDEIKNYRKMQQHQFDDLIKYGTKLLMIPKKYFDNEIIQVYHRNR